MNRFEVCGVMFYGGHRGPPHRDCPYRELF